MNTTLKSTSSWKALKQNWTKKRNKAIQQITDYAPWHLLKYFSIAGDSPPTSIEELLPEGWEYAFVPNDPSFEELFQAYRCKKVLLPIKDFEHYTLEQAVFYYIPLLHVPEIRKFLEKISQESLSNPQEMWYLYTAVIEFGVMIEQDKAEPFGWEFTHSVPRCKELYQGLELELLTVGSASRVVFSAEEMTPLLYIPNFQYLCSEDLYKN